MFVPDVNVLLAAYRADHPHHGDVHTWWLDMLSAHRTFHVPDPVWVGFVRIATNRRIFTVPADLDEAFAFVDAVRAQPGYRESGPDQGLVQAWADCCRQGEARGDLVPDAYIAACARRLGATVVTRDRDFRRFDDLAILDPAAP